MEIVRAAAWKIPKTINFQHWNLLPMNKFSPDHLELLARYYNMIDDEISRKKSPVYKGLTYDSKRLMSLERELIKYLKKANGHDLDVSIEVGISDITLNNGDEDIRLAYEYLALMKALSFEEYSLIERDDLFIGALRSKNGVRMLPDKVFLEIDVSVKLTSCLKTPILRVEWSFIQAMCFVSNKRYIIKHLRQCPLELLIKIKELLEGFKMQFDARRFVPIKYRAYIDEKEVKWTGRGVMPKIWGRVFEVYGKARFVVDHESHDPHIEGTF